MTFPQSLIDPEMVVENQHHILVGQRVNVDEVDRPRGVAHRMMIDAQRLLRDRAHHRLHAPQAIRGGVIDEHDLGGLPQQRVVRVRLVDLHLGLGESDEPQIVRKRILVDDADFRAAIQQKSRKGVLGSDCIAVGIDVRHDDDVARNVAPLTKTPNEVLRDQSPACSG